MSLQQQNQDTSLLLLQGLDCLTLVSLDLLILYNELVMLSFPSFPFIVLFLQVFWSNFEILLKFLSKKSNRFLAKPSTSFLSPASLILSLTFSCLSKSFHCFFFLFLELCFYRFRDQTVFFAYLLQLYVYFLQISLLGLQEAATLDFLSCFWLVPFHEGSKMISKNSRRYCKFFAFV